MRSVRLEWRSCGWRCYLDREDRFVGACCEDYEGKLNNQDEDGAGCGEHYFCDVCDSDMGVILSQF